MQSEGFRLAVKAGYSATMPLRWSHVLPLHVPERLSMLLSVTNAARMAYVSQFAVRSRYWRRISERRP